MCLSWQCRVIAHHIKHNKTEHSSAAAAAAAASGSIKQFINTKVHYVFLSLSTVWTDCIVSMSGCGIVISR